jgi:hypothetical protein
VTRTILATCLLATSTVLAQTPATRGVFLDKTGVVRWSDNNEEVRLFGANYVITTASDYRAAGYVGGDRKKMIDEDMAHFARMGWDGMRVTFWGDWEASDSAGNLIANDHLDLMDYLIARARERGIYLLFSPIQLYSSNWPDAMQNDPKTPGFGRVFGKERMGKDPAAIASQVNYLKQILDHVNPYTKAAIKDEPAIVFIELVNEPWHHPEDMEGSVRYLNTLTDALRSTGCNKLVFYNVSQDFRIGEAIRRSKVQGITFGWYPTGLNSGYELPGNYLRTGRHLPRHAAAGDRADAADRVRVRQSRPHHRHDVPRDGAHHALRRHADGPHVLLRHARHRVPQPWLADPLPEPGLHPAEGDECDHRGRGDEAVTTDAVVREVSGEHAVRGLQGFVRREPGRAGREGRLPVHRLDPLRAARSRFPQADRGRGLVTCGAVRWPGDLLPRSH